MNIDKEHLAKRLKKLSDDVSKDLTDSYYDNDEFSEYDDIALADVMFQMVSDVLSDENEMNKLLNAYMGGLNRSREVHTIKYRDFDKYRLIIYNYDIVPKIGDKIIVTMLDQRNGNNMPRDFELKVIQLPDGNTVGIGETGNLNVGFTNDCIKSVISA